MARENKRTRDERRFGRPERLADMAFSCPWVVPNWCNSLLEDEDSRKAMVSMKADFLEGLGRSVMVIADNVAEFLYAENPKEEWRHDRDFPSCIPPFTTTFIEVGRPSRLLSGNITKSASPLPDRWGWLLRCETRAVIAAKFRERSFSEAAMARLRAQLKGLYETIDRKSIEDAIASPDRDSVFGRLGGREKTFVLLSKQLSAMESGHVLDNLPVDAHWLVNGTLVAVVAERFCLLSGCNFMIDPSGRILGYPVYELFGGNLVDGTTADAMRDQWNAMLFPAELAISFMNCKNVSLADVEPPREFNRERKKAGLRPFVRYHTINIEPMKQVLRSEGGSDIHGLQRALHICRGHFATYSEDKPLFGRVAGTFWRPSHVRGSLDHGVVVSDYDVNAPMETPPCPAPAP